jgi:hypothetical protein
MHFLCNTLQELWGQHAAAITAWRPSLYTFCLQSAGSQADTQQMLSSCPSSSLWDDHVMESNRAAFCFRPETGLVAGPRNVHKAVLAGSNEHEKRSLAGWQRESLRTRKEALP